MKPDATGYAPNQPASFDDVSTVGASAVIASSRAVAALPKRDVAMSAHGLRVASSSMISLVQLKQTGE